MGCSASKLEEEEAVQVCKDRKDFIKQAIKQRLRFAAGHIAYIQSIRRVSIALCNYMERDEHQRLLSDAYSTSSFIPTKKIHPDTIKVPLKSLSSSKSNQYLIAGDDSFVSVEQSQSSETMRMQSYEPTEHFGVDAFFTIQSSPRISSQFSASYNHPYPPPSPQNSNWDSFWNPFSSLDTDWYYSQYSIGHGVTDDSMADMKQVDDIEVIPDREEKHQKTRELSEGTNVVLNAREIDSGDLPEANTGTDTVQHVKEYQSQGADGVDMSETQNAAELDTITGQEIVGNREATDRTPRFSVNLNITVTSMSEAMRDIDYQFARIYDCADEVSEILETSKSRNCSATNNLTAIGILNPVALIRSASSSSSRFLHASTSPIDEKSESSEETNWLASCHHSTLGRLYAWEKKLYEDVKHEERIWIAYEKKCRELQNLDITGADPTVIDKTSRAIRDLRTKLRVSIRSIEAISKRIEALRDEELHPQLKVLIQGLTRMWRTMASCHRTQKHIIDQAKLLLTNTSSSSSPPPPPPHLVQSATILEREVHTWRSRFTTWITSQRLYAQALAGWVLRCSPQPELPNGNTTPATVGMCIQWSRLLESVSGSEVVSGLEFFEAGIGSVIAKQREREEEATRKGRTVVVVKEEEEEEGDLVVVESARELAVKVACAGLGVAVGALAEFAVSVGEGMNGVTDPNGIYLV